MTSFEQELNKSGYVVFTNKGTSMMPLLRQDRDVMTITAKRSDFHKNDAVLFKRDNGKYILHRITKVLDGGYFIVGDNCTDGEFVRNDQMLGILTSVIRGGKKISVDSFGYKLYVFIVPFLRTVLKIRTSTRHFLYKMYHKYIKRSAAK